MSDIPKLTEIHLHVLQFAPAAEKWTDEEFHEAITEVAAMGLVFDSGDAHYITDLGRSVLAAIDTKKREEIREDDLYLIARMHKERGRIIETLGLTADDPGFHDGFAENLVDMVNQAITRERVKAMRECLSIAETAADGGVVSAIRNLIAKEKNANPKEDRWLATE